MCAITFGIDNIHNLQNIHLFLKNFPNEQWMGSAKALQLHTSSYRGHTEVVQSSVSGFLSCERSQHRCDSEELAHQSGNTFTHNVRHCFSLVSTSEPQARYHDTMNMSAFTWVRIVL